VDRSAWLAGLLVVAVVLAGLRFGSPRGRPAVLFGVVWLLAFLAPVIPLAHHTYLYYLYVPWAGGAATAAGLGAELIPPRWGR
jgi:glycerol uptake facilitator-like aquaporin